MIYRYILFLLSFSFVQAGITKVTSIVEVDTHLRNCKIEPHGTVIFFDVDDTAVTPGRYSAGLGTNRWMLELVRHFKLHHEMEQLHNVRTYLLKKLDINPVEDDTVPLLNQWANMGYKIIYLTARSTKYLDGTEQELTDMGFPINNIECNNNTSWFNSSWTTDHWAAKKNIVCTGGYLNKGVVASQVLDLLYEGANLPERVVLVDDNLSNHTGFGGDRFFGFYYTQVEDNFDFHLANARLLELAKDSDDHELWEMVNALIGIDKLEGPDETEPEVR